MRLAPFTRVDRDALGRVMRVESLVFIPVRCLPNENTPVLRQERRA